jgi:hypothetical protein
MTAKSPSLEYIPQGMSVTDALDHVCAVSRCDRTKAFQQLRLAVQDQVLRFRSPQELLLKESGYPELSHRDALKVQAADDWFRAQFLMAPVTPERLTQFEAYDVCREDVLRTWPINVKNAAGRTPDKLDHVKVFLREKYPAGIPAGIKYATLLHQMKSAGVSGSERTLRRARRGK